jgi:hypothetical protein
VSGDPVVFGFDPASGDDQAVMVEMIRTRESWTVNTVSRLTRPQYSALLDIALRMANELEGMVDRMSEHLARHARPLSPFTTPPSVADRARPWKTGALAAA